jgi:hypothetical protein
MSFAVTIIQTLSAFAIFVAGYVMLLISVVCAVVLASCLHKGVRLMRAFIARSACHALTGDGLRQRSALNDESTKAA